MNAGSTRGYLAFFCVIQEEIKLLGMLGERPEAKDRAIIGTGVGNLSPSVRVVDGVESETVIAEAIALALGRVRARIAEETLENLLASLARTLEIQIPGTDAENYELTPQKLQELIDRAIEYQARSLCPYLQTSLDRVSVEIERLLMKEVEGASPQQRAEIAKELWRAFLKQLETENLVEKIDDERFALNEEALHLYSEGVEELHQRSDENLHGKFPKKRADNRDPNELLGKMDVQIGVGGSDDSVLSLEESLQIAVDLPFHSEKELLQSVINSMGRGDSPGKKLGSYLNRVVGEGGSLVAKSKALQALLARLEEEGILRPDAIEHTAQSFLKLEEEKIDTRKLDWRVRGQAQQQHASTHVKRGMRRSPSHEFSGLKAFQTGDSSRSIHLAKTSSRITKRQILDLPIQHNDLFVKRYRFRVSADYIMLLDTSHSMIGYKMETAKLALAKFIKSIGRYSEDRIALIEFDSSASLLWNLENVKRFGPRMLTFLASLEADGGTDIKKGLEKAEELLRRSRSELKHVIVMSDGRTIDPDCRDILSQLQKRNSTLSAVAIGEDADEHFLYSLARHGGGAYFKIQNPSELDKILKLDHYLVR
jgi:Mg-chelatase subunit ChlD